MRSLDAETATSNLDGSDGSQEAIGEIIRRRKSLTEAQVEQVLMYQRKHGVRFGEAAIALKLATHDDVMQALSVQFDYPHSSFQEEPCPPELVTAARPFSDQAEIFRDLRSQLLMGVLGPDQPRRALAVISPNVGDGKSYVAANLAVSLSQLGANTLIVDADLRSPRLHALFGVPSSAGLSGMLSGRGNNEVFSVAGLPSLFVLPAGATPPNPLELIERPAFGLLVHELLTRFDHVVVDTPAAALGSDARVIANKCGATLVLARRGATRTKALRSLLQALHKGPSELAGITVNNY